MTDRERAIKAIRRGVPLGEVVKCSCFTNPPTRRGCFGVCEDTVAAIVTSYEDLRRDDEAGMTWWNALTDQERTRWAKAAGNTGRAKDAWEKFKQAGSPALSNGEC